MKATRGKQARRLVNFPVQAPEWKNTHEGELSVRLIVLPTPNTGGRIGANIPGFPVGDNWDPYPESPRIPDAPIEAIAQHIASSDEGRAGWLQRQYPEYSQQAHKPLIDSGQAVLFLDTASWTGYASEQDVYWSCDFKDLTDEGKALYHAIQQAYPDAELHLRTYLSRQ